MYCPRLEHFTRLNSNGTIGKCGHMVEQQSFESHDEMQNSNWLRKIKKTMEQGVWPAECRRCNESERAKGESVRTNSLDRHKILKNIQDDYLIVGGVLDNTCNSACQTCNSNLSTLIGSLESKKYKRINNLDRFKSLPNERIVELDISGGEPTASKNYRQVLRDLPENIQIVRMNTNGSRMIKEIEQILERGITVIVTLSLDGLNKVHDYTRWPIRWVDYTRNLDAYLALREKYKLLKLDFWTTVSCLNIGNLQEIKEFARSRNVPHDWAFLDKPSVLNVRYSNRFTIRSKTLYPEQIAIDENNDSELDSFMLRQDRLRNIRSEDYLNF